MPPSLLVSVTALTASTLLFCNTMTRTPCPCPRNPDTINVECICFVRRPVRRSSSDRDLATVACSANERPLPSFVRRYAGKLIVALRLYNSSDKLASRLNCVHHPSNVLIIVVAVPRCSGLPCLLLWLSIHWHCFNEYLPFLSSGESWYS